ncbi:hypothetical protein FKM82_007628 [Ascaphus truei]
MFTWHCCDNPSLTVYNAINYRLLWDCGTQLQFHPFKLPLLHVITGRGAYAAMRRSVNIPGTLTCHDITFMEKALRPVQPPDNMNWDSLVQWQEGTVVKTFTLQRKARISSCAKMALFQTK